MTCVRALRLPVRERREQPLHDAALAPEHAHGAIDAPRGVGAVVLEIDRGRGAIVLAHRVDRGRREAALVLGERARVEERRAARAPAAELGAQIEQRVGADQPLRQRRGLDQEEPVVVARARTPSSCARTSSASARCRAARSARTASRMIEREAMRDAAAAVVAADEELARGRAPRISSSTSSAIVRLL